VAAVGEVNFVVNRDHPNAARDRGRPARRDGSNVRRQTAEGVDYMLFVDAASRRLVDPLDVTQYETAGAAEASVRSPLPGEIIDLTVKAGATPSASR
jgi:acetyl/propionyl-CoA carboxylase alpha subunit